MGRSLFNFTRAYFHFNLICIFLVPVQAQWDEFSFMQTHANIQSDQAPYQQQEEGFHKINGIPVYGYDRASQQATAPTTWIISFNQFANDNTLESVCKKFDAIDGATCDYIGHQGAVPVVIITATEKDLTAYPSLAADFIEADGDTKLIAPVSRDYSANEESFERNWGLDRINGRVGLDNEDTISKLGAGINIFGLDTGINVRHPDFGGRALPSADFTKYNRLTKKHYVECAPTDASCATDIQGHGTHTAGIAVSKTFGVAKGAIIHAVKVLGDDGSGKWSWLLGAMDWVTMKAKREGMKQAIITASLGGKGPDAAVKEAITNCNNAGISVVVAAGNENADACNFLPSSVPQAITIGSIDEFDIRSYFSNTGSCVDLFAPGSNIISLNALRGGPIMMSGTSMATPFVAGAAALALGEHPDLTPAGLTEYLRSTSTIGCITDVGKDSPNLLLYTGPDTAEASCTPQGGIMKKAFLMPQDKELFPLIR